MRNLNTNRINISYYFYLNSKDKKLHMILMKKMADIPQHTGFYNLRLGF